MFSGGSKGNIAKKRVKYNLKVGSINITEADEVELATGNNY